MALYDNQHWLLSHIRDSFLSSDDTGICEMVMLGEDIPKQLKSNGVLRFYPEMEESDDEDIDVLSESYDIQMDMEFSHRQRSNTAQRLEKMDLERKIAAKVKHVKWAYNPNAVSISDQSKFFQRKNFRRKEIIQGKKNSLLSEQLVKCPNLPTNSFTEYARFDGNVQIGVPVRRYRIFMSLLPKEQRMYPLQVIVVTTATVQEFIGLICYHYANEHPDHPLKDVQRYGLYITEDDGEVDWDLPCLDPAEIISKFEFITLGLLEMKPSDRARHNTIKYTETKNEDDTHLKVKEQEDVAEDLARMEGHTTAMEAPLYQSYRVHIINKVRTKTEIHLGISGEKIEIDPVITGKGARRFWNRQHAISYHIDNIAWCEITENKGSKTTFTLVYTPNSSIIDHFGASPGPTQSLHQSASFKNHEFEADSIIAEEIVKKINHILELHSSKSRKEFLVHRERKAARRKSFHLHK